MSDITPQSRPLLAAAWMTGALAGFSTMAVAGRALGAHMDTFEVMLYRSLIGALIVIVVASALKRTNEISSDRLSLHFVRNIFHFSGQNLWFYAITVIPLAQVFALEFSYPIWVTLAAPFVLGERLTRTRMACAFLGFVGILIIVRPGVTPLNFGLFCAFLCAIGFAGSALVTKVLTKDQSIVSILFWLTTMQAVFGLICAGFDGDITLPNATSLPWVTLVAICGLGAHLCLTKALSVAPAAIVTPIDFLRLPTITIVAAVLYGEMIDPFVLMGAALIFLAIFLNLRSDTKKPQIVT